MPAPDHLIPLLTALGDGGTVATADAVVAAAGGLPGQVPAPTVDVVMVALGDGGTRDVAGRMVDLYNGFTMTLLAPGTPPEMPKDDAAPVVNESVEPVTPELAEAIAPTDPDAPEADASGGEDSDEDEWEASGLDEFAGFAASAHPDPEPVVDAPVVEAVPAATIRAWAKANGITCTARGAIPAAVREQYDAAQA